MELINFRIEYFLLGLQWFPFPTSELSKRSPNTNQHKLMSQQQLESLPEFSREEFKAMLANIKESEE